MENAHPGKRRSILLRLVAGVALLYALGLGLFVVMLPAPMTPQSPAVKADAIVALTGDGDRLGPAVTLLEQGDGKRLLITGVFPAPPNTRSRRCCTAAPPSIAAPTWASRPRVRAAMPPKPPNGLRPTDTAA